MSDPAPKIVATDGRTLNPGDNPWEPVAALGELTVHDRTEAGEVVARCREAEVLIVNKTRIDAAALAELPALRFITMAATGFDCVDVAAAAQRGVPVANIPVYGTDSVAQYVFSALLNLVHNVAGHDAAVREGEWQRRGDWCFWQRPLVELAGLTMGIVGFGRIGRRVGELAHAFGMRVLAHDPLANAAPEYRPFAFATIGELFASADVVSLHCPLTADNREFVNAALLARMKRGAFFINAARGSLVNEADLARALAGGQIAGACLDVVSAEPIDSDSPLLRVPNLFLTPHLAWATLAARRRLMATIADNIRAFLAGRPQNLVNQPLGG